MTYITCEFQQDQGNSNLLIKFYPDFIRNELMKSSYNQTYNFHKRSYRVATFYPLSGFATTYIIYEFQEH